MCSPFEVTSRRFFLFESAIALWYICESRDGETSFYSIRLLPRDIAEHLRELARVRVRTRGVVGFAIGFEETRFSGPIP